jgi:hypothetical protein
MMAFVRRKDGRMTDIGPHVEAHLVTVVYPNKPQTEVWVERPSPDQHEECLRKARADRARRYQQLIDERSDERLALLQEVQKMNKEEVVEALMEKEQRNLERQALNDVLFSEDYGSDWGSGGEKWSAILEAITDRYTEIDGRNAELKAANASEEALTNPDDDEEIQRLSKVQETFETEVKARRDELVADWKLQISVHSIEKLREDLIQQRIDLECDIAWFATFKFEQLYRAVRYMEDHTILYFKNANQIKALPRVIQEQLMDGLNEVDIDVEALKNSLTPLPS